MSFCDSATKKIPFENAILGELFQHHIRVQRPRKPPRDEVKVI